MEASFKIALTSRLEIEKDPAVTIHVHICKLDHEDHHRRMEEWNSVDTLDATAMI